MSKPKPEETTYQSLREWIDDETRFEGHTTIFSPCGCFSAPNPALEAAMDDHHNYHEGLKKIQDEGVKEGPTLYAAFFGPEFDYAYPIGPREDLPF